MKIVIANSVIVKDDAIGNDILCEFSVLKDNRCEVYFYTEMIEDRFRPYVLKDKDITKILSDKDTILIYHHGFFWEKGERMLRKADCKVIFKYHNVTPSHFFERYCKDYYAQTFVGREQTKRIVKKHGNFIYAPDSAYNGTELKKFGAAENAIFVLPPFNNIGKHRDGKINPLLLNSLSDGKVNVLFVGRLAPNKGHMHLIEVIRRYVRLYDREVRLNIVGGRDPKLHLYDNSLRRMISHYKLEDVVCFRDKVDSVDLATYYQASDVFLLMSEHEGFCVPILEAQSYRLPVIALDRGAVKETLGKEQIIYHDLDYDMFAAAIHVVARNKHVKTYLVEMGLENYQQYKKEMLKDKLIKLLNKAAVSH